MNIITKIGMGIGAIVAFIAAKFFYDRSKRQEGKKEAQIEAIEAKNQIDKNAREIQNKKRSREQDKSWLNEILDYLDDKK